MDESPAKMYVLASALSLLAIIPVFLRFRLRGSQKQALMVDDWLIIPALIGTLGTAAAMLDATAAGGLGLHTKVGSEGPVFTDQTVVYLKANFVTLLTQMISYGCTKLSVLFFYRRLFRGKVFNAVSWILIVLVVMWTIAFFFAHLLECLPIDSNWLGTGLNSTCVNELPMYITETWSDAITDIAILILPMPIIWKLQLSTSRKFGLIGVFLLGALTVMSSVARLIIYYNIQWEINSGDADITYLLAPTFYWPLIESSLGIIGACLPTLRPMFSGFSPESVMRSFRSRVTLGSMRSAQSANDSGHSSVGPQRRSYGFASHKVADYRKSDQENHSCSMDLDSLDRVGHINSKDGGIMVEHTYNVV